MDASLLIDRPPEVTRSTVQKAVVVIADNPQSFGTVKERLSVVTHAWFDQRDFKDTEILKRFQDSLADEKERGMLSDEEGRDTYLGMSLREMVHEFKWQTLVLLKCCLLQPKVSTEPVSNCVLRKFGFDAVADRSFADVIFWLSLRAPLHDAVFLDIIDTRPHSKASGLCGSGAQWLRKAINCAYKFAYQRPTVIAGLYGIAPSNIWQGTHRVLRNSPDDD